MRKLLFLNAVFFLAVSPQLLADWEYTQWGMSPDQVISASKGMVKLVPPDKRLPLEVLNRMNAVEGRFVDGALQLNVRFQFDNKSNGLICVLASAANTKQNEAFRDWLIKKSGDPQEKTGLAAIGLQEFHWNKADMIRFAMLDGTPFSATQCKPGHEL